MANSLAYKNKTLSIGDMLDISYKIKEAGKERKQLFKGILIKIKGHNDQNRMITIRRISRSGIGVERIIPVASPYLDDIDIIKKSSYKKSKLYFIRNLSDQDVKKKLYHKTQANRTSKKNYQIRRDF